MIDTGKYFHFIRGDPFHAFWTVSYFKSWSPQTTNPCTPTLHWGRKEIVTCIILSWYGEISSSFVRICGTISPIRFSNYSFTALLATLKRVLTLIIQKGMTSIPNAGFRTQARWEPIQTVWILKTHLTTWVKAVYGMVILTPFFTLTCKESL